MNARKFYLFNPDHDLALANGDENFKSPRLACVFRSDLSYLPMWYAEEGGLVFADLPDVQWVKNMQTNFPQLATISVESQPDFSTLESIQLWGWNKAICKFLSIHGVDRQLLPDTGQLTEIRRLSHRKTAITAIKYLRDDDDLAVFLPQAAQQLSAEEVESFARQYNQTVFKAPWSGSGRGLFWFNGSLSKNALGWCRNVVEKQGCVIGEQVYEKFQDFAMEFKCSEGMVSFTGYSLFETESQGIYKSNVLMSDEAILKFITRLIPQNIILKIQYRLLLFIEKEIAPFYSGYLGVDMFIYKMDNAFWLHPCVEINLRMTMGLVAGKFYNQFVHPEHSGHFYVDYDPYSGKLFHDHIQRKKTMPLETENGQITRGYIALSPIQKSSHYRIRVEIEP